MLTKITDELLLDLDSVFSVKKTYHTDNALTIANKGSGQLGQFNFETQTDRDEAFDKIVELTGEA